MCGAPWVKLGPVWSIRLASRIHSDTVFDRTLGTLMAVCSSHSELVSMQRRMLCIRLTDVLMICPFLSQLWQIAAQLAMLVVLANAVLFPALVPVSSLPFCSISMSPAMTVVRFALGPVRASRLPVCVALLFLLRSPPMLISVPVLLLPADVQVMSLAPFIGSSRYITLHNCSSTAPITPK